MRNWLTKTIFCQIITLEPLIGQYCFVQWFLNFSGMTLPSTYYVLNMKLSHEYSALLDSMDEQG